MKKERPLEENRGKRVGLMCTIIFHLVVLIVFLLYSINAVVAAGVLEVEVQTELLRETSALLKKTKDALNELKKVTEEALTKEEGKESAMFYHERVMPSMEALRTPVDELEMIVDKDMWPMPSYGDLLFDV